MTIYSMIKNQAIKKKNSIGFLLFLFVGSSIFICWRNSDPAWMVEKHYRWDVYYTGRDKDLIEEYDKLFDQGAIEVSRFFNTGYKNRFNIFIHPNRHSLDSAWQKDWSLPDFKSECWMVASGIATKLDIISPKSWDSQSCEHSYSQKTNVQRLITHELVHVFHGQFNESPDFSKTEGIDWFVEGLANYASGQCDSVRILEIKKAIHENAIPATLDSFWTGKLRYGLSGSVVLYIDQHYGRSTLIKLLPMSKKSQILSALGIPEGDLLKEWRAYLQNY
jgi:hypothetical protein